ncbi:MAG: hypothetical protein U1E28_06255 [Beijerinckiaceae bacterium]
MAREAERAQHGRMSPIETAHDFATRLSAALLRGLAFLSALLASTVEECWFEEDRETRESLWTREPFF